LRLATHAITTEYWKPGHDWAGTILRSISAKLEDGDIVAISEKALAVAQANVADESKAKPGVLARILTIFWMRVAWGILLGRLCHMRKVNLDRLRDYPIYEGSRHKQVCLDYVGFYQSLRPFSEGGVDTTNLPYSLASLPIKRPQQLAEEIRDMISNRLGKNVIVTIVDSDKTYSRCGIHLASRATDVGGIVNLGFFAYLIGRAFRWKARSTPLGWAGRKASPEFALRVAGLANKARGHGAGRTAWDMAHRFQVGITEVDWKMLESVEHRPIVILRPRFSSGGLHTSGSEPTEHQH